jgi:hypothetical protein
LRKAAVQKALRAQPSDGLRIFLKRELQATGLIDKPTNTNMKSKGFNREYDH